MARPSLYSDDALLAIARETFLEEGPGVSTAEIAERAGVSQATLFKRFGSKDELLVRALMPPEVPPFVPSLERGPDKRPVAAQLTALLVEMDDFFERMTPAFGLLRSLGRAHFELLSRYEVPPPVRVHRALSGWLDRAARRGLLPQRDPDAIAAVLMGSLHTRRFMSFACGVPGPGGSRDAFIASLVALVLGADAHGDRP